MNKDAALCSVISDDKEKITDWICSGLNIGTEWLDKHYTIGFVYQNRLIGGLIYHNIRQGRDVWWTLYTIDKHWCCKRILKFMFSVAYDYFACKRITIMTDCNNFKCIKLAQKLGFTVEGILSHYGDNGEDKIIMGVQKKQFEFYQGD